MDEEDNTDNIYGMDEFIDAMSEYMQTWKTCESAVAIYNERYDQDCTRPFANFKKLLLLFHRALSTMHEKWFDDFFKTAPYNDNMLNFFINQHYTVLNDTTKDIPPCQNPFYRVLYLFSFTYSILNYCERNGMRDIFANIKRLFKDIIKRCSFEEDFKLQTQVPQYIAPDNLHNFLMFFSDCYCIQGKLTTYVLAGEQIFVSGVHNKDVLDKFKKDFFPQFKSSFLVSFRDEIASGDLIDENVIKHALAEFETRLGKDPTLK